jgi:hypothetical protein
MIPIEVIEQPKRECDGCTKCCDGWLFGTAHNHEFWPGKKCHFVGVGGCSIYNQRPEDPCKTFSCVWKFDERIPNWMKPNLVNAIVVQRQLNEHSYIEIHEAGGRLDPTVLSWFFMKYATGVFTNIRYQLDGGWQSIGSLDFLDALNGKPSKAVVM